MARLSKGLREIDGGTIAWKGTSGVCFASDFGGGFMLERVWDDALDLGVLVRSPRTGAVATFVVVDFIDDPTGEEIVGWKLRMHDPRGPSPVTLTVYND